MWALAGRRKINVRHFKVLLQQLLKVDHVSLITSLLVVLESILQSGNFFSGSSKCVETQYQSRYKAIIVIIIIMIITIVIIIIIIAIFVITIIIVIIIITIIIIRLIVAESMQDLFTKENGLSVLGSLLESQKNSRDILLLVLHLSEKGIF